MLEAPDIIFATLADPNRRAIFERLCHQGEQTVRALTTWAQISQPAVSKHLCLLKLAGLVLDRREGRNTYYSARPVALTPLIDWTSQMSSLWKSDDAHEPLLVTDRPTASVPPTRALDKH